MRKIIGSSLAAAMLLAAGVAYAENLEGTIEEIDRDANTIVVDGQAFLVDSTTGGASLDELKEGDKVDVQFTDEEGGSEENQFRLLQVNKIQE
jgi:Cu/Ag efflux protein CusF